MPTNDSKTWQRRTSSGLKISSPTFASPILPSYRKQQDTPKSRTPPFCRRKSRTVFITALILFTLFLFWEHGSNFLQTQGATTEYSIVFDAGSTGSRVHVYSFLVRPSGGRVLVNDDFHQLKPGLSSYSGHPAKGAKSLVPLLEAIEGSIPTDVKATTPCELRATAGLRLLPGAQSTDLLDSVTELLINSSYSVANDSISILDGDQEGAYAWLTVNYLLGKQDLVADQRGGGSVQEAYAISTAELDKNQTLGTVVHYGNSKQAVYVHSYLGYGLMAARALILNSTISKASNPCIPTDYTGTYKYAHLEYIVSNTDKISALKCRSLVKRVLNTSVGCGAPADQCTFNGVWGGPKAKTKQDLPLYLFSYFWDRAIDVGIIHDLNALTFVMAPNSFTLKSNELCSLRLEKLKERYPNVEETQRPFLCMDLTYISVLLLDGLKLDRYKDVTLSKQIQYRGNNIETSWTLGAAINSLSQQSETSL